MLAALLFVGISYFIARDLNAKYAAAKFTLLWSLPLSVVLGYGIALACMVAYWKVTGKFEQALFDKLLTEGIGMAVFGSVIGALMGRRKPNGPKA